MAHIRGILIFLCVCGILPSTVQATETLDFQSARTLMMSGAGRGGALLTDTVYLNPALLGFQQAQGLSGTYDWLNRIDQRPASTAQRVLNATAIDGKNPYVVAGAGFTRRPDIELINLGLAKQLMPWFSVGLSAKRFTVRPAYETIAGSHTGYDGGASLAFQFKETPVPLQLGITADNLLRNSTNERFIEGRKLGAGVRASFKDILTVYADFVRNMGNNSLTYSQLSLAGELALGGEFFVRGGLGRLHQDTWSVGGSWMAPRIGFNYGYQRRTDPRDGYEHALTVDIYI